MAKIEGASIYVRMCKLRHRIKKMQYMMTKADRVVYGTPLLQECAEVLRDFVLAYEFPEERAHWYRKMIADFAVLRIDLEGVNHESILKEPKKKTGEETMVQLPKDTDRMYLAVFQLVGEIDEDISRWRSKALRSKTVAE